MYNHCEAKRVKNKMKRMWLAQVGGVPFYVELRLKYCDLCPHFDYVQLEN